MKTRKLETVHVTEYKIFDDLAAAVPNVIDNLDNTIKLHSPPGAPRPDQVEERNAAPRSKRAA